MKRKTEIFISIIISIVFLGCANSNKANNNSNEDLLEPSLTPTASYSISAEDVDSILSSITDNSGLYQLIIEDDMPDEKYIARALNNYSEIFVILDFSKTKLETISFNTFANPTIKKIILPDTLKIIGKDAFYGCTNLVSINIPDSVTEIKDSAFQSCSGLKQIQIGKNVILLGEQAFTSCVKLESIKWGESLETIGMKAFSSCDKLSSVIIPDSVKTIKSYAFRNCVSLEKVTIGKGTQFLEWEIFVRCPSLTSIKFIDKNDEIPAFWGEYFSNESTKKIPGYLGVCAQGSAPDGQATPSDVFKYGIDCRASDAEGAMSGKVPVGFELLHIPEYTWAVFKCVGPAGQTISDMWDRIYKRE